MDDGKNEDFDRIASYAEKYLAKLGYTPVRELPWRSIGRPSAPFRDESIESDLTSIRDRAAIIDAKLRSLRAGTDPFTMPLVGDESGLLHNEALYEAQVFLEQASKRMGGALLAYQKLVSETPSQSTMLTDDDLNYIDAEVNARKSVAEDLLKYCDDPDSVIAPPLDPHGDALNPIDAGTLAQRYAYDAFDLSQRFQLESDAVFIQGAGDELSAMVATVGANGVPYIRRLSEKLERSRQRSRRFRGLAVSIMSILLVVAGVIIDRTLTSVPSLGNLAWLSIAAGFVMWLVDRTASQFLDKKGVESQIRIMSNAVTQLSNWMQFLRQQESNLNTFRASIGKDPVRFVVNWE